MRPSCSGDGDTTVRCPSCGRERTERVRNARATRITPDQLAEAQRRVRAWDTAHPRAPHCTPCEPAVRLASPPNVHHGLLAVGGEFGGRRVARTDDSAIDDVSAKPASVD